VPAGGTTGQVLAKASAADFNTGWVDPQSGGGADIALPTAARVWRDDFHAGSTETGEIGEQGWTITNGSIVAPASVAQNHPGVITRRSGTTAAQVASMYVNATVSMLDHRFDELDVFYLIGAMIATNADHIIRFGLAGNDVSANPPTHGVFIERLAADASFFGVVRNGGAQTRTAALIAQDLNFHKFRIRRVDATHVGFQVDALSEVVIGPDANIPDAADAVKAFLQIVPSSTTARDYSIDFASEKLLAVAR
jgi:hypothetical protein